MSGNGVTIHLADIVQELVPTADSPEAGVQHLVCEPKITFLILFRNWCPQLIHLRLEYNTSYVSPDERKRGDNSPF